MATVAEIRQCAGTYSRSFSTINNVFYCLNNAATAKMDHFTAWFTYVDPMVVAAVKEVFVIVDVISWLEVFSLYHMRQYCYSCSRVVFSGLALSHLRSTYV